MDVNPYLAPQARIVAGTAPEACAPLSLFSTHGRIGRLRYLSYMMVIGMHCTAVIALSPMLADGPGAGAFAAVARAVLYSSALLTWVLGLFYTVRRLNDSGFTGWGWVLFLMPVGNVYLLARLLIAPGTPGRNQYGPPPPPNSRAVVEIALGLPLLTAVTIWLVDYFGINMPAPGAI